MVSSWESVVVAIGIILLFYFARRYTPGHKNPKLKKTSRSKEEVKPLEKILSKKSVKQASIKLASSSTVASNLVMHPHSFERAKKEYVQYAQTFSGLYEVLYSSFSGKLNIQSQQQLLKNWEEEILGTDAPNLTLAWNTIIQKYCGRNFYFKGNTKQRSDQKRDSSEEERILQDWLKTLLKWGLHREPRAQILSQLQAEAQMGEVVGAQELTYYWVINGEVLEEGGGQNQSLGQ